MCSNRWLLKNEGNPSFILKYLEKFKISTLIKKCPGFPGNSWQKEPAKKKKGSDPKNTNLQFTPPPNATNMEVNLRIVHFVNVENKKFYFIFCATVKGGGVIFLRLQFAVLCLTPVWISDDYIRCPGSQICPSRSWLVLPNSFGPLKRKSDACQFIATNYDLNLELQKYKPRWNNSNMDPHGWAARSEPILIMNIGLYWHTKDSMYNITTNIDLANLQTCWWSLIETPQRFIDNNGKCHPALHAYQICDLIIKDFSKEE